MASTEASARSLSTAVRSFWGAAAAALSTAALLICAAAAAAAPAPLHLSVVVAFRQVKSNGSYELRELVDTGGRQTGEGSTRCSRSLQGRRRCSGSFTLEQGQIDFAGTISGTPGTTRFAITGGRGRYGGTHGTAVAVYSHGGTRAAETITFD